MDYQPIHEAFNELGRLLNEYSEATELTDLVAAQIARTVDSLHHDFMDYLGFKHGTQSVSEMLATKLAAPANDAYDDELAEAAGELVAVATEPEPDATPIRGYGDHDHDAGTFLADEQRDHEIDQVSLRVTEDWVTEHRNSYPYESIH